MTQAITHEGREARAARLKERIYLTFAILAVVVAIEGHGHPEALDALLTVVVSVAGTLLAIFVADVISHLVVHETLMDATELRATAVQSFGAASAVAVPVLFLVFAVLGWWEVTFALNAAAGALLVALVVIGWIAVRKLRVRWWQRLIALGAETAVGLATIGLQILAKS